MKHRGAGSDEERFAKTFPSRFAWKAADEATDKLSVEAPMSRYIDAWIAAYKAAGGRTKL